MRLRPILAGLGFAVVVAALAWQQLHASLQPMRGTWTVAGAHGAIAITYDGDGIPHIEAGSARDAYLGLGFAHARDRLWQMEMNRRIGAGRLSEVFGPATLATDKFLRALDVYGAAEASFAGLTPQTREAFEAYAAGVNAALAGWRGTLPPEFVLLGLAPGPWRPADSLVWLKMMAWDLGGNWEKEVARLELLSRLTPAQLAELMPPYPGEAPVLLPRPGELYAGLPADLSGLADAAPPAPSRGLASNNWALAGARTVSGKPLLANDPHLGLSAPSLWYFAHLTAPGLDVIGATLPGVPVVVLGHNGRFAWAFTNTAPDVQDLYIEKLAGEDAYLAPDGLRRFETRATTIAVRGGAPVPFTARRTRHGPVISDAADRLAGLAGSGYVVAMAWTGLADDDRTADAGIALPQAGDHAGFRDAMRDFAAPQQSMLFAAADGTIAFLAPGRVPVRHPDNRIEGLMPVPGWDARYDWQGFIPFDELPQAVDPPGGVLATANEKVVGPDYPHFITRDWALPYRAERIGELLGAVERHDLDSLAAIQTDVVTPVARRLLPLMLPALPAGSDDFGLAAWDGAMDADAVEPLVFAAWLRAAARTVYADELGPLFERYWELRPDFLANVLADVDGQSRWCDDIATPAVETCHQRLARAWFAALADLERRFGPPVDWSWGRAHPAVHEHRPFSRVGLLRRWFEIAVPSSGSVHSISTGTFYVKDAATPFVNRHAPSLRVIYDLADLDRSRFVFSTGQSGNPLSPHYRSLTADWAALRYRTLSRTVDRPAGRLDLVPLPSSP